MKIYQSNLLNNFTNISHLFTTKDGGVSKGAYKALNLAFHVEDKIQDVNTNHNILASYLNYEKSKLIHMKQIHSNIVHVVSDDDNFKNPPTCDALITDKKETPLMVMVADCTPILFYDDIKKVIAVAHAGRQGAFSNIVKNVIDSFICTYASDAKDIMVSIGANIHKCCYEVGYEIYKEAKELNLDYAIEIRDAKYYLDINKILTTQLLASKVESKHIEILDECSCCKNDTYFSYRASRICGRFGGVIFLR
jgi:YfiH family protein